MKTILRSDELQCPSCINKIETRLNALDGVATAKVHFTTGRIEIEHDPVSVDPERLREAVRGVGYDSRISSF